jgi:phosphotransacetylase
MIHQDLAGVNASILPVILPACLFARELNMILPDLDPRFASLLEQVRRQPKQKMAVVHPTDALSLEGALAAAEAGVIDLVLVGPRARIQAAADELGADLSGIEIVETEHSHASAATAVALAREGKVNALMKGAISSDELLSTVIDPTSGLRTARRASHVYVLSVPDYPKLLLVTDAAINIEPDLGTKRDIVQNAVDLAHALGNPLPKVAILSAVEKVKPQIQSTIDAAALCKMADRKQITGAIIDGPLAFDNAISLEAAEQKGIDSPVAGDPDILVVPDLVSGNILAKQLTFLGHASSAGLVMGARVPVALTSRAENVASRIVSAALAALVAVSQQQPARKK